LGDLSRKKIAILHKILDTTRVFPNRYSTISRDIQGCTFNRSNRIELLSEASMFCETVRKELMKKTLISLAEEMRVWGETTKEAADYSLKRKTDS
jgi:hypothetical protein